MIIANPIYDVVFKRMMENDRVAKFFIGTLLDQNIETIEVKPQEFTYSDDLIGLAVFRLDFIATITTETGEKKKVLIEIQKAKNFFDLMRFRNYLAEQYKKEDLINNTKVILPITTIYILGFRLPEINTPCLKVERSYVDKTNKIILNTKSDFIEKLTHDSYVVQIDRITTNYQTKLDKLLSIFEQTNFVDDSKIIKEYFYEVDTEEIKITTDILHFSCTNPTERKKIETEVEAWRTFDALTGNIKEKYTQELLLKDLLINKKEQVISEKEQEISQKEQEISQKKQEISQKEDLIVEKDKIIEELLQKLNKK